MSKIKNTLLDLNDFLFEEIERLNNEELSPEELQQEINRSKAIEGIAARAIDNAKVVLDAAKIKDTFYEYKPAIPRMLIGEDADDA